MMIKLNRIDASEWAVLLNHMFFSLQHRGFRANSKQSLRPHSPLFLSLQFYDYLKMCWTKRYRLLAHSVASWALESTCQTCGTFFSLR